MSGRALVVDDEALNVLTLTDILELHGWEVTQAFNGSEGVAAVQEQDFDVVLMDVRMPDMSGVQALREMRLIRRGLRVILMTAYSAADILHQAREEGAIRILSKPLELGELVRLLEEAMEGVRPVLIVDEDWEFLQELSRALEEAGYETLWAGTLAEALRHLGRTEPLAVALDMPLENLDPREVATAMKEALPSVIFVLYSGQPDLLERARNEIPSTWIKGTLSKPFDPEDLLRILEELESG